MTAKAPEYRAASSSRKALRADLRALTGRDLAEVRITPARYGDGTVWCVMALVTDADAHRGRREVPLPKGAHHTIAARLRMAFPDADWTRAQDYFPAVGLLREHLVRLPACLRGDEL